MENHATRPEFRAALEGRPGRAIRYSRTLWQDMMYVAVPVTEDGRLTTVVRTAVPLTRVNDALASLYGSIAVSAIVVAVIAAIIGLYVSRRISGQMRAIKVGAERLAAGDFTHKLSVPRVEEFASVAESINHMAGELDDKLRRLTHERNEREAVLASMVEGVLAVDTDERVIAVNAAAARLLDTDPASAEGKAIQEVVRNPDLQHVVAQTLDGHRPVEADIVMRVGAEERNLQANGTLLHGDDDGDDVGRRRRAQRRDAPQAARGGAPRLRRQRLARAQDAGHLDQGLRRDPRGRRPGRPRGGAPLRAHHLRAGRPAELDHRGPAGAVDAGAVGRQPAPAARGGRPLRRGAPSRSRSAAQRRRPRASSCATTARGACFARVSPPLLEQAVVNLIDNAVKYSAEGSTVVVDARGEGRRGRR